MNVIVLLLNVRHIITTQKIHLFFLDYNFLENPSSPTLTLNLIFSSNKICFILKVIKCSGPHFNACTRARTCVCVFPILPSNSQTPAGCPTI